jgi:hypothetical protein
VQNAFCRVRQTSVQASLAQKQRLQQLFFPQGIAFDGNGAPSRRTPAQPKYAPAETLELGRGYE